MSNTFSLTSLCGCSSPCPTCCGGCCPSTPASTLYCTLSTNAGTRCEDGTVITLTYNSGTGKWEGTGAFGTCGQNTTLAFYCGTGGAACGDYKLDVSFSDACVSAFTLNAVDSGYACTCSPFHIRFDKSRAGGYGAGCSNSGLGTSYWTVTE